MKTTRLLGILSLLALSACTASHKGGAPVALSWQDRGYNAATGCYDNQFVIRNISGSPLAGDWSIYYSQLPRDIVAVQTPGVQVETVNANYFRISPAEGLPPLAPADSLVVRFSVSGDTPNVSQQPEGCYYTAGAQASPMPVALTVQAPPDAARMRTLTAQGIYERNALLAPPAELAETDILPTLKQIIPGTGKVQVPPQISLLYGNELADEAGLLRQKLSDLCHVEVIEGAPFNIKLELSADTAAYPHPEQYRLRVEPGLLTVEGLEPHGVFNGTQTLLAMLKGNTDRELRCMEIGDYPDLGHRGFMLDVVRNFTPADSLKKLVDLIASYKMNVLHFHCTDDEGWRLQIPGLEELTEVGAHRGHTTDEADRLYPGYDGHYDPDAPTTGNGYYTRADFVDLLKYAARRHVRVVTEIESPGHARAAIVAMKARYRKYIGTDPRKATEYLLSDPADTSVYVSAQAYTDNVINVALPSAYRFMEKVVTEIKAMYQEAGVPLTAIHIGGDEVAQGAWMGSPVCRRFMEQEGIADAHGLFEYFFRRVAQGLQGQGLQFCGWQEVALHNAPRTDELLRRDAAAIYCWNTVPDWGDDEIPYQIANSGYPIVLCNVNNLYLDLAYNAHYDERGHSWGGYVDEEKTFSLLPYSVYRSARTTLQGEPRDLDHAAQGKEPLRHPERLKGVQAQLFAETIRGFDWVEYYMFPKILGLVERGWNAHPVWENLSGSREREAYYADLSRFYDVVGYKELPFLQAAGVNFRLPLPGLKLQGGQLLANVAMPGAEIRYTTDGSEPTPHSALWTAPVACSAPVVKAKAFYLGKESVTTVLTNPAAAR